MDISEVISVEEGMKRVVNNKMLYRRLLGKFSGRQMVEEINEQVSKGDYAAAATTCHALKGLAANLAMHPMAEVTASLEERLKNNEKPEEDLLSDLNNKLEAVEKAVSELLSNE